MWRTLWLQCALPNGLASGSGASCVEADPPKAGPARSKDRVHQRGTFRRLCTLPDPNGAPIKAHSVLPVAMAIAVAAIALPTLAAVGVTITLGEPNFYGRIDLGRMAPPPIIRDYPVQVRRGPRGILLEPLYVRVTDA
jgi:hypothetical protein